MPSATSRRCWRNTARSSPPDQPSRYEEVDAKAVAFKAFKVAYDRESGYVGYKVSGDEFKLECTKFDKLLLVFKDGPYKVTELPEKSICRAGIVLLRAAGSRTGVHPGLHESNDATYLKRFTFGGTILNKAYLCIPAKSRILFFAPDTPAVDSTSATNPRRIRRSTSRPCNPSARSRSKARRPGETRSQSRKFPRSPARRPAAGRPTRTRPGCGSCERRFGAPGLRLQHNLSRQRAGFLQRVFFLQLVGGGGFGERQHAADVGLELAFERASG